MPLELEQEPSQGLGPLRLAKAILVLRDRSQRDFADFAGVSEQLTYGVFNGRFPPSEAFKNALSEFLDTPRDILFPDESAP